MKLLLLSLCCVAVAAWTSQQPSTRSSTRLEADRRSFLGSALAVPLLFSSGPSQAATPPKVLVVGGTGLVGSRVVQQLKQKGIATIATSTDGRDGTIALQLPGQTLPADVLQGVTAVVSCVGAIGTDQDRLVNGATATLAQQAKQAGVQNFVYVTVAPEVVDMAQGIDLLEGYMAGKAASRKAVLDEFGSKGATLIEPTFIYGGDSFSLTPPRVATFYGRFIEDLLSTSAVRAIEGFMPEGILKVALEPPVSADDVAAAAVAGALGQRVGIWDSHDSIVAASL